MLIVIPQIIITQQFYHWIMTKIAIYNCRLTNLRLVYTDSLMLYIMFSCNVLMELLYYMEFYEDCYNLNEDGLFKIMG